MTEQIKKGDEVTSDMICTGDIARAKVVRIDDLTKSALVKAIKYDNSEVWFSEQLKDLVRM